MKRSSCGPEIMKQLNKNVTAANSNSGKNIGENIDMSNIEKKNQWTKSKSSNNKRKEWKC